MKYNKIKSIEKLEALITLTLSKKEWKQTYSLGTRLSMRIFSIIFPGVLKIKIIIKIKK